MNFLKELEKKTKTSCDYCKYLSYLENEKTGLMDVQQCEASEGEFNECQMVYLKEDVDELWRSFWKEKIKELKEEIKHLVYCRENGLPHSLHRMDCIEQELLFAKKQVKK